MSNPKLFLVEGEAIPDEIVVVTAEVRDKTVSEEEEDEEHHEDGGGGGGGKHSGSAEVIQEEERQPRLLGGNTSPVEDGFKTPVPADHHEIISASECPPAPKKPKPIPSRKRKLLPGDVVGDSNNGVSQLVIHLSDEEVEAMFPQILPPEAHNKIKKARRDDDHDEAHISSTEA